MLRNTIVILRMSVMWLSILWETVRLGPEVVPVGEAGLILLLVDDMTAGDRE